MANKKLLLGILIITLVFGMTVIGCGDGGSTNNDNKDDSKGGSISGTWKEEYGEKGTLTFTGSNYKYAAADGSELSSGTYTLASDGKDISYKQTSPTSATFKGYYFPKEDPPHLTADFIDANAVFNKVTE